MSRDVVEQVAGFVQVFDREHPPITIEELEGLSTSELVPRPRKQPNGLLVAIAAAAVVILVVGGLALLVNTPNDTAPAATTIVTPTVAEATPSTIAQEPSVDPLPKADGTVGEMVGEPGVFTGDVGPLGPVSIQQTTSETTFIPQGSVYSERGGIWTRAYGGIVETPDGFTALGVTTGIPRPALATSTDGFDWEIIEFAPEIPGYSFGAPARLFEAGGWYWIGLNEPYLYRSPDSINWERIDLGGSMPGVLGVPIADQRWHEFDRQLVAPTGEGLLVVHMDTGTVKTIGNVPWELPPNGFWSWMTAIDGKLTVFVSSVPDTPLTVQDPVVEQYETTDLITWSGPLQPAFATDEETGLLMHGDATTGITAIEVTGALDNPQAFARRYFSADGLDWQRTATVDETAREQAWSVIDQHLAPVRVNGRQGLIYQQAPRELHVSADGATWQAIRLQNPELQVRDGASLTILGNRIFYYEHQRGTGPWVLNSWIISIGE